MTSGLCFGELIKMFEMEKNTNSFHLKSKFNCISHIVWRRMHNAQIHIHAVPELAPPAKRQIELHWSGKKHNIGLKFQFSWYSTKKHQHHLCWLPKTSKCRITKTNTEMRAKKGTKRGRETSRWSTRVKNYDTHETIVYSGDVRQAIRLPLWRFVAFK